MNPTALKEAEGLLAFGYEYLTQDRGVLPPMVYAINGVEARHLPTAGKSDDEVGDTLQEAARVADSIVVVMNLGDCLVGLAYSREQSMRKVLRPGGAVSAWEEIHPGPDDDFANPYLTA